MGLSDQEKTLLEELTRKAAEADAEDFEVEIFSGDKGARVPLAKAAGWLYKEFGIGEDPNAGKGDQGDGDQGDTKPKGAPRSLFGGTGKRAAS
jgi:hypothetical protein